MHSMNRGMDCVHRSVDSMDSMMGRDRSIVGSTFIRDINNIATVGISSVVVDHLGSAVRESNSIGSRGGVAISLFICAKLGSAVVISNAILISIGSRLVIRGL